ncbi:toxin glutamine deamidase domain-containing protein [Nocardia sienata]|uniref:toxin glutamine deamidase domain-containing protein n=1 Tax=Nocardia sienata TaxID=248552 RepID=UPI0012EEDD6D|nr:toxin glutamine deamidase domain-containing protein [Nocardia sienata]
MGIEIPGALQWVAKYVVGAGDWPEGDETAMRRVATAWKDMATALDESGDDAALVMRDVLAALDQGQTHTALAEHWGKVGGGDDSALPMLVAYCESLSRDLDDTALDIEHTKMVIIASMVLLAAELTIALATAWTGVGAAAGAAAKVATQAGIRMAIRALIERVITNTTARAVGRVALKGAKWGVLEGTATELAPHLIQIARRDRQSLDGDDWKALWDSAKAGGIGGAVGGGLGSNALGAPLANRATSPLGRVAADLGIESAAGVAGNVAGTVSVGGDLTLETFTSGAVGSAADNGAMTLGTHLHNRSQSAPDLGAAPDLALDGESIAPSTGDSPQPAPPDTAASGDSPSTPPAGGDPARDSEQVPGDNQAPNASPDPGATASSSQPGEPSSSPQGGPSSELDTGPPSDTAAPASDTPAPTRPDELPPGSSLNLSPDPSDNGPATESGPATPNTAQPPDLGATPAPDAAGTPTGNPASASTTSATATSTADAPTSSPSSAPLAGAVTTGAPATPTPDGRQGPDVSSSPIDTGQPGAPRTVADPSPGTPSARTPETLGLENRSPARQDGPNRDNTAADRPRTPLPPQEAAGGSRPSSPRPNRNETSWVASERTDSGRPHASSERPGGGNISHAPLAGTPRSEQPGHTATAPTAAPPPGTRAPESRPPSGPAPTHRNPGTAGPDRDGDRNSERPPDDDTTPRDTDAPNHRSSLGDNARSEQPQSRAPMDWSEVRRKADRDTLTRANLTRAIEDFAHANDSTPDQVWNGLQVGALRIDQNWQIYKRQALPIADPLQRPDTLSETYLNDVIQHNYDNGGRVHDYQSMLPDSFEPGCPDNELPPHLTRDIPTEALSDSVDPVDVDNLFLNTEGDGGGMWRDLTADDAFLRPENALFRMDSRGPEQIFDSDGFHCRNPGNPNMGAHIGSAFNGGGAVSFSRSPEHAIMREDAVTTEMPGLERLPNGLYRQVRYMYEAYHPYGLDTEASFRDRREPSGHREAEVLAPGGLSSEVVYRVWPRHIVFDGTGRIVSATVLPPVYNPGFRYNDHPNFTPPHDGSPPPRDNIWNAGPAQQPHPTDTTPPRDDNIWNASPDHQPQPLDVRSPVANSGPDTNSPSRESPPRWPDAGLDPAYRAPESNPPILAQRAPDAPAHAPGHLAPARQPAPTAHTPAPRNEAITPADHGRQSDTPVRSAPRDASPHNHRPADPTRAFREACRQRAPEGGRITPVTPAARPRSGPAYQVRRISGDRPGQWFTVPTIRVHVNAAPHISPAAVHRVLDAAQTVADRSFNNGQRLVGGDWLLLDVVYTNDPSAADLHITVDTVYRGPNTWHPDATPDTLLEHLRRQLGLPPAEPGAPSPTTADLQRLSNDLAAANTRAPFADPSAGRVYGTGHLSGVERPEYQMAVENALRDGNRFLVAADPRVNPYGGLINDGGPTVRGRNNNCVDCCLSALSAFFGRPVVSAPRWPDPPPPGGRDDVRVGEENGLLRAAAWLRQDLQTDANSGRTVLEQYRALHDGIARLGPGSAAFVVHQWHARDPDTGQLRYNPDGTPVLDGNHASLVVYPLGAEGPVWWDPQSGVASHRPPANVIADTAALWFSPIPSPLGANDARTVPHPGASENPLGPGVRSRPGVPDLADRARMGMFSDPDITGDRGRDGSRSNETGGRLGVRNSDRVSELVGPNDRGRLLRSETNGPGPARQTDTSEVVAGVPRTDTGGRPGDRISAESLVSGHAPAQQGILRADQQADTRIPSDGNTRDSRGGMGATPQQHGRSLAGTGDLRGLAPLPPTTAGAARSSDTEPPSPDRVSGRSDSSDRSSPPRGPDPEALDSARPNESGRPDADTPRTDPSERPRTQAEPATRHNETVRTADGLPSSHRSIAEEIRQRISQQPEGFQLTYTGRELDTLIAHGRNLGLSDREVVNLIQTGSRIAKPIEAGNLARQMEAWVNTVSERGYPYKFEGADHFNRFTRDFHRALDNAGLSEYNAFIQGSSLRTPEANDVDFAVFIERDRFNALLVERYDGRAAARATDDTPATPLQLKNLTRSEIRELAERIIADRSAYNSQAATFANAALSGIIKSTHDISKPLKVAAKEISRQYPELNIETVSLVVPGSTLDSGPELPVLETTDHAREQAVRKLEIARELEKNLELSGTDERTRTISERTAELHRELAQQNLDRTARLLDGLGPYDREIVDLARQLADANWLADARAVQAALEVTHARQALEQARDALIRGGSLSEVSSKLTSATERIAAANKLESEIRMAVVRGLELGELTEIVEQRLELDVLDRNSEVSIQCRILEQDLVESAVQRIHESDPGRNEFVRFAADTVTKAGDLEVTRSEGRTPDIQGLLREIEAIDQVVRNERDSNSRELIKLELEPAHRQLVARALDSDCRTLESTRGAFERQVISQAVVMASEAREPDARARAQFLDYALNQRREIEQSLARGLEPEPQRVRELGDQLQRAVEYERGIEARALESIGFNAEQAGHIARILESERDRDYGKVRELVDRENVRAEHNRLVGSVRGLEITPERSRTLDPVAYQLVRDQDPVGVDREKRALMYHQPGKGPMAVEYDSPTRRYAEVAKLIGRGVPPEVALSRHLMDLGQARDPVEAVRRAPTPEDLRVKRARELDARNRERGLERGDR